MSLKLGDEVAYFHIETQEWFKARVTYMYDEWVNTTRGQFSKIDGRSAIQTPLREGGRIEILTPEKEKICKGINVSIWG